MALVSSKIAEDKRVELEIKVGEEVFAPAVERIFKKRSAQITMPGFRKGKAPRNLIVKTYGMGVFVEDAVNELYPAAYNEAVVEAGIEPVDVADIEITTVDDNGFTFKATVAVKPEAKLGEYKGLAVTKLIASVTDAQVDEQITSTQERNTRMVSVDSRPTKEGDITTIDFEGFVDDVPFEGGKGEDYPLTLGSGTFIPGFEDQVIGKNLEEPFDVNVTFPETYGVDELDGKEAVFKVLIHEIKEKELPELDDEFAKDVSEFDTFAEYRADLRAKLEEAAERNAATTMENDLMKDVVAGMTVDVPQAMVERRIDDLVRDFEYRLQMQGLSMDQFLAYTGEGMEGFRGTFAPQAEQQVLVRLALEAIVAAENIEPTSEELEAEYARLAEQYNLENDKIKSMVPESDMKTDLACNMALDLVKSTAKVTIAEAGADVNEEKAKTEKKTKKTTTKKAAKEDDSIAAETKAPKKTAKKAAVKDDEGKTKAPKKRTTKAKPAAEEAK